MTVPQTVDRVGSSQYGDDGFVPCKFKASPALPQPHVSTWGKTLVLASKQCTPSCILHLASCDTEDLSGSLPDKSRTLDTRRTGAIPDNRPLDIGHRNLPTRAGPQSYPTTCLCGSWTRTSESSGDDGGRNGRAQGSKSLQLVKVDI